MQILNACPLFLVLVLVVLGGNVSPPSDQLVTCKDADDANEKSPLLEAAKVGVATGAVVGAGTLAASAAVGAAGFGSGGIVAGTLAAAVQAKAGAIVAGSTFATLQSLGATAGIAALAGPLGLAAAGVGAGVAYFIY